MNLSPGANAFLVELESSETQSACFHDSLNRLLKLIFESIDLSLRA
jgi:hypothetical protein